MYSIMLLLLLILGVVLLNGSRIASGTDIAGRRYLNRSDIWSNVLEKHGLSTACSIFPRTYVLPADLALFQKEYRRDKEYIFKTLNSGKRKGVFLYEEGDDLSTAAVIQEYIPNPVLINGFKFGIRCFLMIDCDQGAYLYRPFYAVYTEKPFEYHSKDRAKKINQAGQRDDHLLRYSLPATDAALKRSGVDVDDTLDKLANKLAVIVKATPQLCGMIDMGKRQVYGVDAELLADGDLKIIEINSRPQLEYDSQWKSRLIRPVKHYRDKGVRIQESWIQLSIV